MLKDCLAIMGAANTDTYAISYELQQDKLFLEASSTQIEANNQLRSGCVNPLAVLIYDGFTFYLPNRISTALIDNLRR